MKGRKRPSVPSLTEQILSEDYWEGYYALDSNRVVRCQDRGGNTAVFAVYSLKDGRLVYDGSLPYVEGARFSVIDSALRSAVGKGVSIRLSDEVSNPDRDAEIEEVINSGEPFELARIRNLVSYISSRGIRFFGGTVGGRDLYGGEYCGFYLLGDGKILFCRDLIEWDRTEVQMISDGVIGYRILDPEHFSDTSSKELFFGYLRDDTFSAFMEKLSVEHGTSFTTLGLEGDENFELLQMAMGGDPRSADLASHRLRVRISV